MAFLLPCPQCARHVRRTESSCPFCAGALSFVDAPLPRVPRERLGRAAIAFGAAVATSVTMAGCTGNAVPLYGAPAADAGQVDSGGLTPDAAGSADTGTSTDAAAPPIDAFELDTGGSSSDYGAPPPP